MKLEVRDITKAYKKRLVLRGVNMEASAGEIVGILGANGAGKTTLFSILIGMETPDNGTITLDNRDITKQKIYQRARAGITYLPQDVSIFRGLSVEDNIRAILQINLTDTEQIENRVTELLQAFDIAHIRRSKAPFLSGGERRKVEIARALATSPAFLLLDEPFAGVDPISISEITDILHRLTASGIGIIITDHNVRETMRIIDRGYIIADGKVLTSGRPEEISNNPHAKKLYFGDIFNL